MNLYELRLELNKYGINPAAYGLNGGYVDEALVIDHAARGWSVYYCERGQRQSAQYFDTEDAACRYLFECLWRDSSTRL